MTKSTNPTEIRVGPNGPDIAGADDKAIQAAIGLAQARGVARVRVARGIYRCRNSISLAPGVTLAGEGDDTVLAAAPTVESSVTRDVNHYEREVEVRDPDRFPIGIGVRLEGRHCFAERVVSARAIVARKKGRLLGLDTKCVGENFWLDRGEVRISTRGPVVSGADADNVTVEDLQIDGRTPEDHLEDDGGGGVYLHHCHNAVLRRLYVHHTAADGIGFETSHHVTVEACRVEHCMLPLHAGSGSLHMTVRGTQARHNPRGFYFCWGIQYGLLEDCDFSNNATYGVSIGFHDSHNVIRNNVISGNGEVGVHFRKSHYPSQSPRDDLLDSNTIENNGPATSPLGIHIEDAATSLRLRRNRIRETRGRRGVGVRIERTAGTVEMEGNGIEGFARKTVDLRNAPRKHT